MHIIIIIFLLCLTTLDVCFACNGIAFCSYIRLTFEAVIDIPLFVIPVDGWLYV